MAAKRKRSHARVTKTGRVSKKEEYSTSLGIGLGILLGIVLYLFKA